MHIHACARHVGVYWSWQALGWPAECTKKDHDLLYMYVCIYYIISIQVTQYVIRLGPETKSKSLLDGYVRMY